jgi:hypothetical protein
VHQPNVGEHLQDHAITCQSFEVNPDIFSTDVLRDQSLFHQALAEYQNTRRGPLAGSAVSAALTPLVDASGAMLDDAKKDLFDSLQDYVKTETDQRVRQLLESSGAAVEFTVFPGQVNPGEEQESLLPVLAPSRPENHLTIFSFATQPFTRGSVHIAGGADDDVGAQRPVEPAGPGDCRPQRALCRAPRQYAAVFRRRDQTRW